ncbi:hypothetical protein FHG66_07750 [Rubellimicrobium rubrum]|uniref:Uncharacterized protein n=1 Tax=Rubellimicrobium rubrum TaxID=2585369 RepID=A0A5C4MYW7_9RHOB|nr:alginate O-acetyltransferase AlgF [Rubellimicrobium rubrum]TNC50854.1 hypothetical protein FHG66_07750 [Rubellimicrobium rubrum]
MIARFATRRTSLVLAVGIAALASASSAQDDALYPDASAPDASFLRVYVPADQSVAVDGTTLQPGENGLTPYVEIAPGDVVVTVDGQDSTIEAGPNQHYSWVADTAEGHLLTDAITDSPAQADLVFYNLSDLPAVDVYVPSADAVALAGVAPGQGAGVALRAPLTLDFEFRVGDETKATLAEVEMLRATGTTILLTGGPDAYEARVESNTYAN